MAMEEEKQKTKTDVTDEELMAFLEKHRLLLNEEAKKNLIVIRENEELQKLLDEQEKNWQKYMKERRYEKEITDFLSGYLDPTAFQVYSEIRELRSEGDSLVERAVGIPLILVNDVYSEEEVTAAASAYADWIAAMENKNGGGADFKIYSSDDYAQMNKFNYRDHLGKWIYELDISVYEDKSVWIERYESGGQT